MVEALLEELTPEVPAMTAALLTRSDPNAGIMLWIGETWRKDRLSVSVVQDQCIFDTPVP